MGKGQWEVRGPVDAPELGQQTVAGPTHLLRLQLLVGLIAELLVATLLQWLLQPALLLPRQQLPVAASAPLCPLAPLALLLLQRVCPFPSLLKELQQVWQWWTVRLEQLCQCAQWAWGKWQH
jgi:hypothetical protein